jgi:hypothetical protein
MMRTLSRQRRFALRAIGPSLLLVIAGGLPDAALASGKAGTPKNVCEIPFVCEHDTNRGGRQTAAGTSNGSAGGGATGGTSSAPTGDTSSSPTGETSSAPTGD